MEKEIKFKILSKQFELSKTLMDKLFSYEDEEDENEDVNEIYDCLSNASKEDLSDDADTLELMGEGVLLIEGDIVEINYSESELTGMEGANTKLVFDIKSPQMVTMLRGGSVTTAMVFEQGVRHVCIYETPFMPFELCIHTLKVENRLLKCGKLYLDYIVEFKGTQAERTKFTISIEEKNQVLSPLDEYDEV